MGTKFYKSIASVYEKIFPFKPVQVEFIKNSIPDNLKVTNILDIGCGTGDLTINLSKLCNNIHGIDLDEEMISIANNKNSNQNIEFSSQNMLNIEDCFSSEKYNIIFSFGNTLVHLDNLTEIERFFKQCKSLLSDKGKLLIQIINYDRILDENISFLPIIDNDAICFERFYDYDSKENKINFSTILTIKKDNTKIKNNVKLYPLRKTQIENILSKIGFNKTTYYSNFKRAEYSSLEQPLIFETEVV